MADIECVWQSMGGRGSIFISNLSAAQNLSLLHSKGIRAVLSVARSGLVSHNKEDIPHYLYIPAEDHQEYNILKFFSQTYDFIEKARKETNVLVHCMVGVSRSVTIVIAYLLKKYKYTLAQVIGMIQRKRSKINPNRGFIEQLKRYSQIQGIKCDFSGVKVPSVKNQAVSYYKRSFSSQKQRGSMRKPQFLTPIIPITPISPISPITQSEKQSKLEKKTQILQESQECNVINHRRLSLNDNNKYTDRQNDEDLRQQNHKSELILIPQMKRSYSTEQRTSKTKRSSSIEEKIRKIRQKLKSEQTYQPFRLNSQVSFYRNMDSNKSIKKSDILIESILKNKIDERITQKLPYQDNCLAEKLMQVNKNTLYSRNNFISYIKKEEKQMFNAQQKLQINPLYNNNRLLKRVNLRMNGELHH